LKEDVNKVIIFSCIYIPLAFSGDGKFPGGSFGNRLQLYLIIFCFCGYLQSDEWGRATDIFLSTTSGYINSM